MRRLAGPIRTYAWGSHTALAALQGRPVPSPEPEAELWLGAHPSAPAVVDGGTSLADLLATDPVGQLGQPVLERFGPRLPYLLKVLAAGQPLSLQAHPDADQARAGYAAAAALPVGAARSYVDPYHKPEILVAVEPFDALCGFRPPEVSAKLLASFGVADLDPVVGALGQPAESNALRGAVELLMRWPAEGRGPLVAAVVDAARPRVSSMEPAFALAVRLGELYPGDVGVVLALLLNQLRLSPDEAVFMPAGNLHAYLEGVGVELMAASDNVLRGGLTPKHVDVPELLRVLRYEALLDPVLRPHEVAAGVLGWSAPVSEFYLIKGVGEVGRGTVQLPGIGPRILICTDGFARCHNGQSDLTLRAGEAAFVAAGEPPVVVAAGSGPAAGAELVAGASQRAVVFQASPA